MRRIIIVAVSAALLTTTAWVVHGAATGSTSTVESIPSAAANPGPPTAERTVEHGLRIAKLAPLVGHEVIESADDVRCDRLHRSGPVENDGDIGRVFHSVVSPLVSCLCLLFVRSR